MVISNYDSDAMTHERMMVTIATIVDAAAAAADVDDDHDDDSKVSILSIKLNISNPNEVI